MINWKRVCVLILMKLSYELRKDFIETNGFFFLHGNHFPLELLPIVQESISRFQHDCLSDGLSIQLTISLSPSHCIVLLSMGAKCKPSQELISSKSFTAQFVQHLFNALYPQISQRISDGIRKAKASLENAK